MCVGPSGRGEIRTWTDVVTDGSAGRGLLTLRVVVDAECDVVDLFVLTEEGSGTGTKLMIVVESVPTRDAVEAETDGGNDSSRVCMSAVVFDAVLGNPNEDIRLGTLRNLMFS